MKNNKTKVITIAALIIAVIALSIGFAAFSSTLNISTGASVTPNDTFVVKFSNSNSELLETNVTASDGSQYGGNATIDNRDVKNPKIDNLSASFTAPGQSVTYTFYVRNMGDFDAYLTGVRFNNAEGEQVFQSCTSSGTNPGTQTIIDDVCDDITFTLELEDTPNKVLTSESNFAQVVGNDYKVLKSSTPESGTINSKMVKVTIAYPNKDGVHYADGSFTVNFGSVEMIFATLAGYVPPTPVATVDENMTVTLTSSQIGTYAEFSHEDLISLDITKVFTTEQISNLKRNMTNNLYNDSKYFNNIICSDPLLTNLSSENIEAADLANADNYFWIGYSEDSNEQNIGFEIKKNGVYMTDENYNSDAFKDITFTITGAPIEYYPYTLTTSQIGSLQFDNGGFTGSTTGIWNNTQIEQLLNNSTYIEGAGYDFNDIVCSDSTLDKLSFSDAMEANGFDSFDDFYLIVYNSGTLMVMIKKDGLVMDDTNYTSDVFKDIIFTITGSN